MSDQYEGQPRPDEPPREPHWWARDQEPAPPHPPPGPPYPSARPGRRPDPGTPGAARTAGILAIALIIIVAILQQYAAAPAPSPAPGIPPTAVEPPPAQFEIAAKVYTRTFHAMPHSQVGADAINSLEAQAVHPEDQLRIAIVEADLGKPQEALDRLEVIHDQLTEPLQQDAAALRLLWEDRRNELDAAQLDQLVDHHGWFGELAVTHGQPMTDPQRQQVAGGGLLLLGALVLLSISIIIGLVTGLVLLTLATVWFSSGRLRPRFVPPLPGGSVAIETVAVFVAAFLALKIGAPFLGLAVGDEAAAILGLALQWALLLTLLWPVVRGISWREAFGLWGLHKGHGIAREIGCGILGYLACLPLLLAGVVVTLFLRLVYRTIRRLIGLPDPAQPHNPLFDIVVQHGWVMLILLFLLAVLWAPLVEEAIFRGALYRQLRSRWHWLATGLVTALAFGVMHPYQLLMLGPVIALGFGFALLREWRGSLIASMTAHAIHNTVVLFVLMVVLRVIIA